MALSAGARLGPYEVILLLGQGGMGEVYRARDTKLGRDVALKILPTAFLADADRVARFEREAQTLATLNHPNVATIHGVEEGEGGVKGLVLELVEGPTLAEIISQSGESKDSPLPPGDTLSIARQIAEALEAAHDRGIVHRDLKPANVKVRPDGTVKVLDFGLAKIVEAGEAGRAGEAGGLTHSPTLTLAATNAGVILGTAAYMAPEQVRGGVVDRRADIWAFGVVLFEMLTGKQVFEGSTISDVLASVLKSDPDWRTLPQALPAPLRQLLGRCLEKDPRRRLQAIGEARLQIEELQNPARQEPSVVTASVAVPTAPKPRRWSRAGLAIVAVAVLAWLALGIAWAWKYWTPQPTQRPIRFAIVPPAGQLFAPTTTDRELALSPDGTRLVYVALAQTGQTQLILRSFDRLDAEPLRGATGAPRQPFMSPDGNWIGFFQGASQLQKMSITGGPPITLCAINNAPRGGSWGADGTIVFATSDTATGLLQVGAGGGDPKVLTKPDAGQGEGDHVFPSFLPDGRAVLFTVTAPGQGIDNSRIDVLDLRTGARKTIVRGGSSPEYVAGHVVYASVGSLRAVRFDPDRLEVLGDPVPVVDGVATVTTGAAEFAVSRSGTLVYVPGNANMNMAGVTAATTSLAWVNRQGREEPLNAPPRAYDIVRLSPDETRIAVHTQDQDNDIWIWHIARRTLTRFTFDSGPDILPVWTPDGQRIIFSSNRTGAFNLFWQQADGTGSAERLSSAPYTQRAESVSPDGAQLVMSETIKSGNDISVLRLQRPANSAPNGTEQPGSQRREQPTPIVQTMFDEGNADLSPDGKWLVYESNESGQRQIYVRPFPNVNDGRWQVSTSGGTRPAWARKGDELFYLDADSFLTAVSVQTTPAFSAGNAARLFEARSVSTFSYGRSYDVTRDSQRFLVVKTAASSTPPGVPGSANSPAPSLVVVVNWFSELTQ